MIQITALEKVKVTQISRINTKFNNKIGNPNKMTIIHNRFNKASN